MLWVLVLAAASSVIYLLLSRDILAQYDNPKGQYFLSNSESSQLDSVKTSIGKDVGEIRRLPFRLLIDHLRKSLDSFFDDIEIEATLKAVQEKDLKAEWVLAPGVDYSRRLLYIHGGAFFVGSPKSHRVITSRLSQVANCAVLAVDYRLMPENTRKDGIEDCRHAYDWLLQHSPEGKDKHISAIFIAGDSAGGNLTLSLLSWIRDSKRTLPNAAVALSPVTDMRMVNPSIKGNSRHDVVLGPLYKKLNKVPRMLWSIGSFWSTGYRANHPDISPLHGDLANLPPILIHASEHEILRDDARRYVNKAVQAGTDARLQIWMHMPHVWHIFHPRLPEANQAFDQIGVFLKEHS